MRKHAVPPAAVAFALTFLGCEQTATGPDLPRDLGPSLAIEGVSEFPTTSVLGGACIDSGSPVSWWPGEDNFDDVVDTNPIARSNGVTFAPGVVGQGFRINPFTLAGQSFMEIDDSPNLRPANFTIDLWAQRFSAGQNNNDHVGNILVQKAIEDNNLAGLVLSYLIAWNQDDQIVAGVSFEDDVGAPVQLVGTSVHPFGSVVHVALSFDGTTATLYVNGAAEATFDASGRPPVAYGGGSMVVGATFAAARNAGFPRSPDGIIDEVEIFDYALLPGQIQEIYDTEGACKVAEPEPEVLEVEVDIRPGSDHNPINLGGGKGAKSQKRWKSAKSGKSGSRGKSAKSKKSKKSGRGNANLPVAILTTDDFDARTVDVATVTLGDDDADAVGVIRKKNDALQAALKDVDHDGDLDLVMHFSLEALVTNGELTPETTELCLNGVTSDGVRVHGCDAVTVLTRMR